MAELLSDFLPKLKKHHGIYVMRRTYEGTCAFLTGYEVGSGHSTLKDFHSWLVMRRQGRPELYWPLLVLCEIYEDGALPDLRYFTPMQDEEAVGVLFRLLDDFLESCRISGNDSPAG
ncbi:hypothetical protein [Actinoplanes utahensis]|uniref:hypothetical protein n=1 Tax=Actinoplanes utahensis TaxID=1869 RepID=UPI00126A6406|nr:hypothetical protein [Actinoplanes utahensis]GIF35623.1 hypothetical protein Aut01nite_86090 [Actinoplanes utahensis]